MSDTEVEKQKSKVKLAIVLAIVLLIVLILVVHAYRRSKRVVIYMLSERMVSGDLQVLWNQLTQQYGSNLQQAKVPKGMLERFGTRYNDTYNIKFNPVGFMAVQDGKLIDYGVVGDNQYDPRALERFVENTLKINV
jgi:hypothetical protein